MEECGISFITKTSILLAIYLQSYLHSNFYAGFGRNVSVNNRISYITFGELLSWNLTSFQDKSGKTPMKKINLVNDLEKIK